MTWDEMLAKDEVLSVREFARRAKIGYSTLCSRHKSWADKVRKRRDQSLGKRRLSPVTKPRPMASDLVNALKQLDEANRETIRLLNKLEALQREHEHLLRIKAQRDLLERHSENLRGALDILLGELTIRGIPAAQLQAIWDRVERHLEILPTQAKG